jgi:hypothetical protein
MLALRETTKTNRHLSRVVDFFVGFDLCAPKIIAAKTHKNRKEKKTSKATADFADDADGQKRRKTLEPLIVANHDWCSLAQISVSDSSYPILIRDISEIRGRLFFIAYSLAFLVPLCGYPTQPFRSMCREFSAVKMGA